MLAAIKCTHLKIRLNLNHFESESHRVVLVFVLVFFGFFSVSLKVGARGTPAKKNSLVQVRSQCSHVLKTCQR